ncbi:MAG: hypothetical protein LBI64_08435 [Coriobacteriales bacterium]|nr:hypothetical protein [Coriobacteriales bacterium]
MDFELLEVLFNDAAFRHGIDEADMRTALGSYLLDTALANEDNKYLLIGFDKNGNLIELMYNMIDEHSINVFHAMKCRKENQKHLGR